MIVKPLLFASIRASVFASAMLFSGVFANEPSVLPGFRQGEGPNQSGRQEPSIAILPGAGGAGVGGGICQAPLTGNPNCNSAPAALQESAPSAGAGNPINVLTGNKYEEVLELPALPGELGLEWRRVYNSHSPHVGLTGAGWRSSYEAALYDNGRELQILQADGRRLSFARDPQHPSLCASLAPGRGRVVIEDGPDGRTDLRRYRWQWPDGRELIFAAIGASERMKPATYPLIAIRSARGAQLTLLYQGGQLVRIRDPQGRELHLHYRDGKLDHVSTPVGELRYIRDANGRVVDARFGEGDDSLAHLYHYESELQGGSVWRLTGHSVQRGSGKPDRLATWRYDNRGLAIESRSEQEVVSLDYSRPGHTVMTTGSGTRSEYIGRLIGGEYRLIAATGPGCLRCPKPNRRYRYDATGGLVAAEHHDADGRILRSERIERDPQGRVVSHWQREGSTDERLLARYGYTDSPGNGERPTLIERPSVVAGKLLQTRLHYGTHGQLEWLEERGWRPASPRAGNAEAIARHTHYAWGKQGGQLTLLSVDGPLRGEQDLTRYRYNGQGQLDVIEYPLNMTERFAFDAAGRVKHHVSREGVSELLSYNAQGQVERISSEGVTTILKYDARGRLIDWRRRSDGGAGRDQLHSVIRYGARGDATLHEIDEEGSQRVFAWRRDTRGNVQAGEAVFAFGELKNPKPSPSYERRWQHAEAPFAETESSLPIETAYDGSGRLWRRARDDFGRIAWIDSPVTGFSSAAYDEADRLIRIAGQGFLQRIEYDAAGRRTGWYEEGPERIEKLLARWEYEGPHLSRADTSQVQEVLKYDERGRLISREIAAAGRKFRWTHRYATRVDPNPASTTLPDGHVLEYLYRNGRIVTIQLDGTSLVSDVAYFPGSVTPVSYTLGSTAVTWSVNSAGGLTDVAYGSTRYSFPASTSPSRSLHNSSEYVHTALPASRPGAVTATHSPEPSPPHEHDARGLPIAYENWRLGYDSAARLIRAQQGTTQIDYAYDAHGVQSLVSKNGRLSRITLYDGYRRQLEADANGLITAQYIWLPAPGAHRPIARITAHGVEVLHTDARGAVTEARALDGHIQWQVAMDARGRIQSERTLGPRPSLRPWWQAIASRMRYAWQRRSGSFASTAPGGTYTPPSLRLPGQAVDLDLGTYYNIHRNYDPRRGTYLEPDPIALDGGPDLYAYAEGQPDHYIDPWGLATLQYFAITSRAQNDAAQIGKVQGFTKARWSFFISDIQTGTATTTLGQLRNSYAQQKVALTYDQGWGFMNTYNQPGGYISRVGNTARWNNQSATTLTGNIRSYYGDNLIEVPNFSIQLNDDIATRLVAKFTGQDSGEQNCPPSATALPAINFAAEEPPLDPTVNDPARLQRILACGQNSSASLEQRRVAKYEAAAELNETGRINKDCSTDGCPGVFYYCTETACLARSSAPRTGAYYVASYGRSQFTVSTLIEELLATYDSLTPEERTALGMTPASRLNLDTARTRAIAAQDWFNRINGSTTYSAASQSWDNLSVRRRERFTRETGLGEQAYEDIARMKNSPPSNSNGVSLLNDARQGLITAAIMSDLDTASLLNGILRDFGRFTIVTTRFMRQNLNTVLTAFPAASEEEYAGRIARMHNSGRNSTWNSPNFDTLLRNEANDYVKKFLGKPGYRQKGEWNSLRCAEYLQGSARLGDISTLGNGVGGLELSPISLW